VVLRLFPAAGNTGRAGIEPARTRGDVRMHRKVPYGRMNRKGSRMVPVSHPQKQLTSQLHRHNRGLEDVPCSLVNDSIFGQLPVLHTHLGL
jgi:hypothetical protein